jgi:hypothetical protein
LVDFAASLAKAAAAAWRTRGTFPQYDPRRTFRLGDHLYAKEASMGTSDDSFFARTDSDINIAFEDDSKQGELPHYSFGVVGYGSAGGVVGCGGPAMTRLLGPYSTFAGVHGTAQDFTGVAGTSVNHVGVYGQVEDNFSVSDGIHAGVLGTAQTQPGVVGFSQNGFGVQGVSPGSVGVRGESSLGFGMHGTSDEDSGVFGVSIPVGPVVPNTSNIAGVVGSSDRQHGVIGTSNANVGVIGFSNNIGVLGFTTTPGALAGQFIGDVEIDGNLTVTGSFPKGCAVPFPDGTHRTLYCMESPEVWFEDFGAAKLKRGRAVVTLDADFAKVIKRGDYKVFLTPEGDCRGLYVRRKSAASFEVRELTAGKSAIAFSYRIVGRRKDVRGRKRFAKFDMRVSPPAPRARRPAPTRAAFIAELERQARARATPSMRRSDRKVAAMPPAILIPGT